MSARFSYSDNAIRAVAEVAGMTHPLHKAVKGGHIYFKQSGGLGRVRARAAAMLTTWDGLPDEMQDLLQQVKKDSDKLLLEMACETCGCEEVLDLPDDWEAGSAETRHHVRDLLDLAEKLFRIQEDLFHDIERTSPGRSAKLAIIGRVSSIVIDGERHQLAAEPEKERGRPVALAM